MKKLCILNYGCGAHITQFRQLLENFKEEYVLTHYPNEADLIVEYFCFIGDACFDRIAKELIYIKLVKKETATYIAVGCFVEVVGAESLKGYADYAFGRDGWVEKVTEVMLNREAKKEFFFGDKPYSFPIDIVGGCIRKGGYCTFCKQNYMHIPVKSMPMDEVVQLATDVTNNSTAAIITLDGLNVCNYGIDMPDKTQKLHLLIKRLAGIPTVKWINIDSLTIGDMYEELIDVIANEPKIHKIVLGIQSGSNKMLKIMNVHSTVEQIQYCLDRLSHKSIVTIAVVCHPGETLETIQETIDFVKKNNLWQIQIEGFNYSQCVPAAKMKQLEEEEYDKYLSLAQDAVSELAQEFFDQIMNTWVEGYFENYEYYGKDSLTIYVSALKHNLRLCMSVSEVSKTPYLKMVESLTPGEVVRCKVSEVINDRPNHMVLGFNEMEILSYE